MEMIETKEISTSKLIKVVIEQQKKAIEQYYYILGVCRVLKQIKTQEHGK